MRFSVIGWGVKSHSWACSQVWALCCSKIGYLWSFEVYQGKRQAAAERDIGAAVVMRLTKHLPPGTCVTCDRFFTTLQLAMWLIDVGKWLIGTVMPAKVDNIPEELNYGKSGSGLKRGRYQRINAVIETRSKNAIITHDGTYKYNTHKIYWYDDLGNSVRNVTRNDGEEEATEANIIDKLKRVYGKQQYKVVDEYAIQFGNKKIRPDLVIEKDGKKLVLEIKKSDASAYNKIFLTYELWNLYKSKYKLHPTK